MTHLITFAVGVALGICAEQWRRDWAASAREHEQRMRRLGRPDWLDPVRP